MNYSSDLWRVALAFALLISSGAVSIGVEEPSRQTHVLFKQPRLNGIQGHFHVPLMEQRLPSDQPFNLILWQPNPERRDGQLSPASWRAGDKTGYYPHGPVGEHQAAFHDAPGATTLQIEDNVVGVYLNSRDLPGGSNGDKMMITPSFLVRPEVTVMPFSRGDALIENSLALQIPSAEDANKPDNYTYVSSCFVFEDIKSHSQISYGITLFHHAKGYVGTRWRATIRNEEVGPYDEPSKSFQVGNPVAVGSRVVTPLKGSSEMQTQTWTGWKVFDFAITTDNVRSALRALKAKALDFEGSDNPADYKMVEWHLNAELTFASGPAELGWSMRDAKIILGSTRDIMPMTLH